MNKPNPCDCGRSRLLSEYTVDENDEETWTVSCMTCGKHRSGYSEDDAIEYWNEENAIH